MSNYTKLTDFAVKDTLPTGNAAKIVKGEEIDDEFNAIATAVASKSNTASPTFTGTVTIPTLSVSTVTGTTITATTITGTTLTATTINGATLSGVTVDGGTY